MILGNNTYGITPLYYSFVDYLYHNRKKICLLQLVGRLEDYLVKEFIYHIHVKSNGKRFPMTNIGKSGEHKVDIAIFSGKLSERIITGLIEAKYLRNWHRVDKEPATDEINTTLKSLKSQIGSYNRKTHGSYSIKLQSHTNEIYGLVFASFVFDKIDDNEKDKYYNNILNSKEASYFKYHDLDKPYFRSIYENEKVKVLNGYRYVSLRVGLWKLK